jgi:hypothetical protein
MSKTKGVGDSIPFLKIFDRSIFEKKKVDGENMSSFANDAKQSNLNVLAHI